jgi:hypothetical protein
MTQSLTYQQMGTAARAAGSGAVMSGIDGILAGYESLRADQEAFYKDLHQAGLPGCACGVSWLAWWRYPAGRSASLRSFRPRSLIKLGLPRDVSAPPCIRDSAPAGHPAWLPATHPRFAALFSAIRK